MHNLSDPSIHVVDSIRVVNEQYVWMTLSSVLCYWGSAANNT